MSAVTLSPKREGRVRPPLAASVPSLPPGFVERPRLLAALDGHGERPLTVVTGPAGAGKTVLLSSWTSGSGAAWLSLGPEHADVTRMWRDAVAAVTRAVPELDCLGPIGPPDGPSALSMVDALAATGVRCTLVLDDLHHLGPPAVAAIDRLVGRSGDALRLVVASRSDPCVSLGRLRLAGRVGEVRSADLAFNAEEAGALFVAAGLELSDEHVRWLVARTEGWAAGLRLASMSLLTAGSRKGFLRNFGGDDWAVGDYLTGEVLSTQPRSVRDFLLRTSVVDRVCGELADALTGGRHGARTLRDLKRGGVFLTELEGEGRWYRYHPLFLELLRARLELDDPELCRELHARAAAWLTRHGAGADAVAHLVRAGSGHRVGELMADCWLELLLQSPPPAPLVAATTAPGADERLVVAAAGACLGANDSTRAQALLRRVRDGEDDVHELARLLRARSVNDVDGARQAAGRLLRSPPAGGASAAMTEDARRTLAYLHLGATEFAAGSPARARDALEVAAALAVDGGCERVLLECQGRIALLELIAGRLSRARDAAQAALALAAIDGSRRCAAVAWAQAVLAAVHWLRDELDEADARVAVAASAAYAADEVLATYAVRALRGHLAIEQGDFPAGRALLRAARDAEVGQGRLLPAWLDALGPSPGVPTGGGGNIAVIEAAAGRLGGGDALSALRRIEPMLEPKLALHSTLRLHALLIAAVARQALGRGTAAGEALERALEIAARDGCHRPFVQGGEAVRRLLARHVAQATRYGPLVIELLEALSVKGPVTGLAEPLSVREREVLRLLPTLLPNTQIAGELFVSVNTVKSHVKSIYRKLGVPSRREAVARASELGLI